MSLARRPIGKRSFRSPRRLQVEMLDQRRLLAADAGEALMEFRVEARDPFSGALISEVPVGGLFVMRGVVDDLRGPAEDDGVRAAFADIEFPAGLVSIDGPINYESEFEFLRRGDTSTEGQIHHIGAARGSAAAPGGDPQTLFEVMMVAEGVGSIELLVEPPSLLPLNVLYGSQALVPTSSIRYLSTSINAFEDNVESRPTGVSDGYSVDEDNTLVVSAELGVLSNDRTDAVAATQWSAVEVSAPQRGQLNLNADGSFSYEPDPEFSGTDSFQYRAFDGTRYSAVTKVIVEVAPVDDAPQTNPDHYIVRPGSKLRVTASRGVLRNDVEVDGQSLTVRPPAGAAEAGLQMAADGSFTFTAPEDMTDDIVFEYEASDGLLTATESIVIQASDGSEEVDWETLGYVINVRLAVVNEQGDPLSQVPAGGEFFVEAYVRDLREFPLGVFAAYFDLHYDAQLATAGGAITYGDIFEHGKSGTLETGLVDELGSFSSSKVGLDGQEYLIARVPFTADAEGILYLDGDDADEIPGHESLLYGVNTIISPASVRFGSTSVEILSGVLAADDSYSLDEDAVEYSLDVLQNDVGSVGAGLQIVSASPTASGAEVVIAPDGLSILYTGAQDFYGADTFSYVVEDSEGRQGEATVSLEIANVNDPPQTNDDVFDMTPPDQNGGEGELGMMLLDVLANDSSEPDVGESLSITSVSDTQGLVQVSDDGKSLLLNRSSLPPGTQTLSYSVSDGNGGSSSAMVTITDGEATNPWQNPTNAMDVSNDGAVTPIDALFVINRINQDSRSTLSDEDQYSADDHRIYFDTSGDQAITPIDALLLINYLNNASRAGEGEFAGSGESEDVVVGGFSQTPSDVWPVDELSPANAESNWRETSEARPVRSDAAAEVAGPQRSEESDWRVNAGAEESTNADRAADLESIFGEDEEDWLDVLAADTDVQSHLAGTI